MSKRLFNEWFEGRVVRGVNRGGGQGRLSSILVGTRLTERARTSSASVPITEALPLSLSPHAGGAHADMLPISYVTRPRAVPASSSTAISFNSFVCV